MSVRTWHRLCAAAGAFAVRSAGVWPGPETAPMGGIVRTSAPNPPQVLAWHQPLCRISSSTWPPMRCMHRLWPHSSANSALAGQSAECGRWRASAYRLVAIRAMRRGQRGNGDVRVSALVVAG